MNMKEESEKAGLKLDIHKYRVIWSTDGNWSHHFMVNNGETMETVSDFIFLGSKIIVDGDYSHEIKRLASWKESYDKPRKHI